MENTKAIAEIETKIKSILDGAAEEENTHKGKIEEINNKIQAKQDEIDEAARNGEETKFKKLKAELRDLEDTKEIRETRLKRLQEKELIPRSEYEAMVNAIYKYYEEIEGEAIADFVKYSEAMGEIAEALDVKMSELNKLLGTLQKDIFKNKDRTILTNGKVMLSPVENKEITRWEIVDWGRSGKNHYQYSVYRNVSER